MVLAWLDLRRETLSVTTYEAYVAKARYRLLPALGDIPIPSWACGTLTPSTGPSHVTWDWPPRPFAKSTTSSRVARPGRALGLAQRQPGQVGHLSIGPAGRGPTPSPADVVAAIALADLELATVLRLSASIGRSSRRGVRPSVSNVDLDAGELVIAKALVEKADRTIIEKDTKTHQARRIALDAGTVAALREWRRPASTRPSASTTSDTSPPPASSTPTSPSRPSAGVLPTPARPRR